MSKASGTRKLGWWSAGMLILLLSPPAWALDLDQSINASQAEARQIASRLGRTHQTDPAKPEVGKNKDKSDMRVVLIRAKSHKHHYRS